MLTDPDDVTARQLAVLDGVTGSPNLVLLPEGVVVVDAPLAATARSRELGRHAAKLGTSLVVGVVEGEPDGFRNAAVAYGPDGTIVDRYEKEHRVPFGEYIPARALLSRLTDATSLVPKDAIVGRGTARLRARVPLRTGLTPFARTGDFLAVALACLVVVPAAARSYVAGRERAARSRARQAAPS